MSNHLYHALSRENSIGLTFGNNDFEGPAEYGPEYASVRQIGFETYISIGSKYGDYIGWSDSSIEAASSNFHLSGMPTSEVDSDGEYASICLKFENGELFCFKASTDAVEVMISNLELLARRSYLRQMEVGTARQEPHPSIPALNTHCSHIFVERANDRPEYAIMNIFRGSRPPIKIPIDPTLALFIEKIAKETGKGE